MLTKEEIRDIIINTLYETGIINKEIYTKCSKPHITSLPYDNRTTDTNKLNQRETEIDNRIKKEQDTIQELQKTNDKIETEIYKLQQEIDKTTNKIEDHNDEILGTLQEHTERLDELYDDITRSQGTSQDTRDVWGDNGLVEEYDNITHDISIFQQDIENIYDNINKSIQDNKPLNPYFTDLDNLIKYGNDIEKQSDKIFDTDGGDELIYGTSPAIRNITTDLKGLKDTVDNQINLTETNNNNTKERDTLQEEVDTNNQQIYEIEQRITDYKTEKDKI